MSAVVWVVVTGNPAEASRTRHEPAGRAAWGHCWSHPAFASAARVGAMTRVRQWMPMSPVHP